MHAVPSDWAVIFVPFPSWMNLAPRFMTRHDRPESRPIRRLDVLRRGSSRRQWVKRGGCSYSVTRSAGRHHKGPSMLRHCYCCLLTLTRR